MFKTRKRRIASGAIVTVLALAMTGIGLLAGTSIASASEMTPEELQTLVQDTTEPGLLGDGYLAHRGGGRWGFGSEIDYQQLLADALGIPVEDLEAAYEQARIAALEQAVAEGLITQEQADEMTVWADGWHKRLPFFGDRRARPGVPGGAIDEQALLAGALEVSVEELQQAREKANQAAIEMAIEEGIITQEEADAIASRRALQSYLDRDALLSQALGISAAELQEAYAAGKTLSTLLEELGLDAATVRDRVAAAREAALDQAVADGVITQEQRDEMAQGRGTVAPFPGGRKEMPFRHDHENVPLPEDGERGGMRGGRGLREMQPGRSQEDDGSGVRFGRPGSTDAGSAL